MYLQIISKLLILFIVINYSYIKLYKIDLLNYITTNKTVFNALSIILIVIALYYLFNRDFFLPFLGPAVIPTSKAPLKSEKQIIVQLTDLPSNTNVIYWASGESNKDFEDPLGAYKNYSNSGMEKTDNAGNVTIKVACPGRYYVNKFGFKKRKLPRHIHYRYELPHYEGLYSRVYTEYVKC